jgi:diguanylate cyclase (GGDEF)-like protein
MILKFLQKKNRKDPLTNLLTHRSFLEELTLCMEKNRHESRVLACLVVSLDAFTSINEQYGYEIGNELLFEIGSLLQNFVGTNDVVGRIGGDDFGIVLNDVISAENAIAVADRLCHIFNKNLLPVAKHLTASIGISLCPNDSSDNEILIAKAEKAAREAKKIPGTHSSFSSEIFKTSPVKIN